MSTSAATQFSLLVGLHCSRCGKEHDPSVPQNLCVCGGPLLADYDLVAARTAMSKEVVAKRPSSLWRYHELLPVSSQANVVSFGEGMTPLLDLPQRGSEIGVRRLLMKDESVMPTGTFKARGAAVGVSRAAELGIRHIAMPTNGNAGAAWAAYSARAGIDASICMPLGAPLITRKECVAAGASVFLVDGLIDDAGAYISQLTLGPSSFNTSTFREPYRVEGKKTLGFEIAEQLGWRVPDVLIYPAGGGVGLVGIHKAFTELQALGWIDTAMPRFVAVQAKGCAPIVRAWMAGEKTSKRWDNASTIAFGINVAKSLGDELCLHALYATDGSAVAVSDREISEALKAVARTEGCLCCPEGAATIAAAEKLRQSGWISADDEVVVINTGSGLKYPGVIDESAAELVASEPLSSAPSIGHG